MVRDMTQREFQACAKELNSPVEWFAYFGIMEPVDEHYVEISLPCRVTGRWFAVVVDRDVMDDVCLTGDVNLFASAVGFLGQCLARGLCPAELLKEIENKNKGG